MITIADLEAPPGGVGLGSGPVVHTLVGVAVFGVLEGFSRLGALIVRPGVFSPNTLIAMDFGDEVFAILVQGVEQAVVAAVATVHAHNVETNTEGALMTYAFQGQFWLGAEVTFGGGNAGLFAPRFVLTPSLGQVESDVDEGGCLPAGKAGADGDLAVFNFSQASQILPCDAD